jgi:hypothetical protein
MTLVQEPFIDIVPRTESAPPSEEEIRQRAYELYEARGCEEGKALDDWLQAEAELLAQAFHRHLP